MTQQLHCDSFTRMGSFRGSQLEANCKSWAWGRQVREVGERHVLDCHLNFLSNKAFHFFPFQVGIDFSQPHGNSFSLVSFFKKDIKYLSSSLYFFYILLSFAFFCVLFCFSPWYYWCISPSIYGYFFLPIFFSRSVTSSHDVCTAGHLSWSIYISVVPYNAKPAFK